MQKSSCSVVFEKSQVEAFDDPYGEINLDGKSKSFSSSDSSPLLKSHLLTYAVHVSFKFVTSFFIFSLNSSP